MTDEDFIISHVEKRFNVRYTHVSGKLIYNFRVNGPIDRKAMQAFYYWEEIEKFIRNYFNEEWRVDVWF